MRWALHGRGWIPIFHFRTQKITSWLMSHCLLLRKTYLWSIFAIRCQRYNVCLYSSRCNVTNLPSPLVSNFCLWTFKFFKFPWRRVWHALSHAVYTCGTYSTMYIFCLLFASSKFPLILCHIVVTREIVVIIKCSVFSFTVTRMRVAK